MRPLPADTHTQALAPRFLSPAGERRKRGKGDRRSQEISLVIRNTLEQTVMLELLPRSQLDVYLQVERQDKGENRLRGGGPCCAA